MRSRLVGATRWLRLEAVMIGAIALLVGMNWLTGSERAHLEARMARIKQPPSDLKVADRSRRTVQAIRTLDPHQFAWQVYLPPERTRASYTTGPSTVEASLSEGAEMTVRIGFREAEGEGFPIDAYPGVGARVALRLGDRSLARLLRGRWDQLIVEQAGRAGPIDADPMRPTQMLRLSLSPALLAEARATLRPADWPTLPVIFEFRIEAAEVGR